MSDGTGITWTDATWSPLLGCSPASAGCSHCYAIRDVWRMAHNPNPKIAGPRQGLVERTGSGALRWTGKVALLPEQLALPLSWRKPRRIFVGNQADLFHEDVPNHFIRQVFEVMAAAPQHTFQVLTKRPARAAALLPDLHAAGVHRSGVHCPGYGSAHLERPWPLPNVWLGVSVEDQRAADERILHLLATPAALRFLSCEPLLGPVDLQQALAGNVTWDSAGREVRRAGIGWVIVGGESGAGARPCDIAWIRSVVGQCQAAEVPVFVKQLGTVWARSPRTHEAYFLGGGSTKGADPEEWPPGLRVQEMPEDPCPF